MKKAAPLVLLGLLSLIVVDCIVTYPTFGPPPHRVEVIPARPGHAYVWVGGYWRWSGHNYVWVGGRWVRPRHGREWVPGHWEQRGRRWYWREGHWR
jgi:hypothetical protein